MDLGKMTGEAKKQIDKRGGMESVKEDAQEVKEVAGQDEGLREKGKDAADALQDPGAPGEGTPGA